MDASPDAVAAAVRATGSDVRPFDVHCRSAFTPKIILLSEYFTA
jgi:hypothetical protein